jgi:hypothetical protein
MASVSPYRLDDHNGRNAGVRFLATRSGRRELWRGCVPKSPATGFRAISHQTRGGPSTSGPGHRRHGWPPNNTEGADRLAAAPQAQSWRAPACAIAHGRRSLARCWADLRGVDTSDSNGPTGDAAPQLAMPRFQQRRTRLRVTADRPCHRGCGGLWTAGWISLNSSRAFGRSSVEIARVAALAMPWFLLAPAATSET